MTLLKLIQLYFAEYDLYDEIKKAERKLSKLKSRIMDGDKAAAHLAWKKLNEYDLLKVEFENRNFKLN